MVAALKQAFVRQFMRPTGPLGSLAGRVMSHKNQERIRWAVNEMGIRNRERVLEIGYGPGVAIEELFRVAPDCTVVGVDPSPVMYKQAKKRNRGPLESGRLTLETTTAEKFSGVGAPFDLIFAINALSFCPQPAEIVRNAANWLAPEGRLVIVHQVPMKAVETSQLEATENKFRGWMGGAGMQVRRADRLPARPNPVLFLEACFAPNEQTEKPGLNSAWNQNHAA